jgi:hypothetical protein
MFTVVNAPDHVQVMVATLPTVRVSPPLGNVTVT